jgi:hypothetical protein
MKNFNNTGKIYDNKHFIASIFPKYQGIIAKKYVKKHEN